MTLSIAVHGELQDLLAPRRRGAPIVHALERRAAIKDVLESLGVPHTEIGRIAIDGHDRGLDAVLDAASDSHIQAWPNPRGHRSPLRGAPPEPPAFVLDTHLGRLARDLRALGFDSRYANDRDDATLAETAATEARILLTRDVGLLKRSQVVFARFVRHDDPDEQIVDIGRHFELGPQLRPFSRCSHCNTPIETVDKAAIDHRLEPLTRRYYSHFRHCPGCDRLYWRGSHYQRLWQRIETLRHLFAGDA